MISPLYIEILQIVLVVATEKRYNVLDFKKRNDIPYFPYQNQDTNKQN